MWEGSVVGDATAGVEGDADESGWDDNVGVAMVEPALVPGYGEWDEQ